MPYQSAQQYQFSDQKRNTPQWPSKQCQHPTKWRKPTPRKGYGIQGRQNKTKWHTRLMSQL